MVRDEEDVIGHALRHMAAEGVDGIIVADNMSVDSTRGIVEDVKDDLGIPLIILRDTEVGYYQSRKMTELARLASVKYGARWIVPFDADEVWYAHADRIGPLLRGTEPVFNVARVPLFNHYCTALDPMGTNPFVTMEWRTRNPLGLGKIAFVWDEAAVIAQGNHDVSLGVPKIWTPFDLNIRHFPYRSAKQMVRKAINGGQAYEATDLNESIGAHWRQYWNLIKLHGEGVMEDVFRQHFWYLSPIDGDLVHDRAPWMRP